MQKYFSVFRNSSDMQQGIAELEQIEIQAKNIVIPDKTSCYNLSKLEHLEFFNLLLVAKSTATLALCREESRGAHSREDFPERDDDKWLKHLLYFINGKVDSRPINFAPTEVDTFELQKRVYEAYY